VRFLARLSRIAADEKARQSLRNCRTGNELLDAILQEDRRHG
jgi:mannitol/fructose-specific phosphotransferase system IIA component (Ntr-type)